MKATIVAFLSETHIERFIGEDESDITIVDHPEGLDYDDVLNAIPRIVREMNGTITNTYFEENEFGDPINCFFVDVPNYQKD